MKLFVSYLFAIADAIAHAWLGWQFIKAMLQGEVLLGCVAAIATSLWYLSSDRARRELKREIQKAKKQQGSK